MAEDLDSLQDRLESFVEARDWGQFHTPKNLSMAIAVEAGELMELLQWQDNLPPERVRADEDLLADVEDELADVAIYCLHLARELDVDLLEAVESKLEANERRFDRETVAEMRADYERWQR